jgi:hypothetical protein
VPTATALERFAEHYGPHVAGFPSLRAAVLADPALQARLRAQPAWDAFAQVAGLPEGELEAARQAARRDWVERELPGRATGPLDDIDVEGFTPVHFADTPGGPIVEWCDLRGLDGDDVFFSDRVQRALWEPYRLLFRPRTSVAALEARASDGVPAGLVLHISRCGSTLVCRMLGAVPGTKVLAEPVPCDQVLRSAADAPTRARRLRAMLAALGADGAVVKLDAWSVRERPVVREALPGVPWVFLYRDPAEVIASHARLPGMHMIPGALPPGVLGVERDPAASTEEYSARVLAALCDSALEHLDGDARLVAYADLPEAVMTQVAPHFGLAAGPQERRLMLDAARYDAKRRGERFDPTPRPVSPAARAAADRWTAGAVAELDRLRAAAC